MNRFARFARKPPGIDSAKSKAQATLFLTRARSLEHVTPETLAHTCRLKPATAAKMLGEARERRGDTNQKETDHDARGA